MNITSTEHALSLRGISISGLSIANRSRIEQIGLSEWIEEVSKLQPKVTTKRKTAQHTRVTCKLCDRKFLAERSDAVYCSDLCRKRGSRRELKHRGLTVTINNFSSPQPAVAA